MFRPNVHSLHKVGGKTNKCTTIIFTLGSCWIPKLRGYMDARNLSSVRKVRLELVLHGALLFNIFWIDILKFQKIPKKFLDVDISVLHSPENFQSEIVYIPTYTKMTNSVGSENFKSEIYHFYTAQNTEYFALVFCTLVEMIIVYNYIFCRIFHSIKISILIFFKRAP